MTGSEHITKMRFTLQEQGREKEGMQPDGKVCAYGMRVTDESRWYKLDWMQRV